MRMRIVLCESENRQQHKRIDTDVELIGIRERESTMAADLSMFSLLVLSKSKAFSRFLVYSGYIWRFSGKRKYRACTVLYLKFEHQFHFSFIELNGNCGLLSSRYIWSIGESL